MKYLPYVLTSQKPRKINTVRITIQRVKFKNFRSNNTNIVRVVILLLYNSIIEQYSTECQNN